MSYTPNAVPDSNLRMFLGEELRRISRGIDSGSGTPGPAGPTGDQGDPGAVGPPGPQGDQGIQGEQGLVGPPGPQGDQGIQGDQGTVGQDGAQGPQGDPGPQGEQGIPGTGGSIDPTLPLTIGDWLQIDGQAGTDSSVRLTGFVSSNPAAFINGSLGGSSAANNRSINPPSGTVVGDLLIFVIAVDATATGAKIVTDDNGLTPTRKDAELTTATPYQTLAIFSRILEAGDPASFTFRWGTIAANNVRCLRFINPRTSGGDYYDVLPVLTEFVGAVSPVAIPDINVTAGSVEMLGAAFGGGTGTVINEPGYEDKAVVGTFMATDLDVKTHSSTGLTGVTSLGFLTNDTFIAVRFAIANGGSGSRSRTGSLGFEGSDTFKVESLLTGAMEFIQDGLLRGSVAAGVWDFQGLPLNNLAPPPTQLSAATKQYVDDEIANIGTPPSEVKRLARVAAVGTFVGSVGFSGVTNPLGGTYVLTLSVAVADVAKTVVLVTPYSNSALGTDSNSVSGFMNSTTSCTVRIRRNGSNPLLLDGDFSLEILEIP